MLGFISCTEARSHYDNNIIFTNIFPSRCRYNVNTFTCCHETHFFDTIFRCRHNWVQSPFHDDTKIMKTIMHSSRMRTARSLTYGGGSPWQRPPGTETPWTETPWDGDSPGQRPPRDRDRDSPLWTEWLTDRCKNITFTNFVCGR